MKTQVKKGVLEIFVLAMLTRSDSYGYKLISDLNGYVDITESTLYPILRRLDKSGELVTYDQVYQSRNRKYYSITDVGKRHVDTFLEEWEDIRKIYDILRG